MATATDPKTAIGKAKFRNEKTPSICEATTADSVARALGRDDRSYGHRCRSEAEDY